jgi:tetratricopeptide (TPR) repeat protein
MSPAIAVRIDKFDEVLRRAQTHWNAGEIDEAEGCCREVLAAWPGHADALHLQGMIADARGDIDLAIECLYDASLSSYSPAIYSSNLAELYRRKGLFVEAQRAARRAVATDPNLAPAWNNLGLVLQDAGQLEESRICLERVVALRPRWAEGHHNLGNVLSQLGLVHLAAWRHLIALTLNRDFPNEQRNRAHQQHARARGDEFAPACTDAQRGTRLTDRYVRRDAEADMAQYRYMAALEALDPLQVFPS